MALTPAKYDGGELLTENIETIVASITPNIGTIVTFDNLQKTGYKPILGIFRATEISLYDIYYPAGVVNNNSFNVVIKSRESSVQTNKKVWAIVLYQKE